MEYKTHRHNQVENLLGCASNKEGNKGIREFSNSITDILELSLCLYLIIVIINALIIANRDVRYRWCRDK